MVKHVNYRFFFVHFTSMTSKDLQVVLQFKYGTVKFDNYERRQSCLFAFTMP